MGYLFRVVKKNLPEKDSGDDYTALEYTKNSNKNTELHAIKW